MLTTTTRDDDSDGEGWWRGDPVESNEPLESKNLPRTLHAKAVGKAAPAPVPDPWCIYGDPWGGRPSAKLSASTHQKKLYAAQTPCDECAQPHRFVNARQCQESQMGIPSEHPRCDRNTPSTQDWDDVDSITLDIEDVSDHDVSVTFASADELRDIQPTCGCSVAGLRTEGMPRIATFGELRRHFGRQLPDMLLRGLAFVDGSETLSPSQGFILSAGLSGRDVACCAEPGSKPTAAVLAAALAGLCKRAMVRSEKYPNPGRGPCRPRVLVLAASHSRCTRLEVLIELLLQGSCGHVVSTSSEKSAATQIQEAARDADVMVGTADRLSEFVRDGAVVFDRVGALVLDGVDALIAQGSASPILEILAECGLPPKDRRQTLLLCCQLSNRLRRFASDHLFEEVWVVEARAEDAQMVVTDSVSGKASVAGSTSSDGQHLQVMASSEKPDALVNLLGQRREKCIVFLNSGQKAQDLEAYLQSAGVNAGAVHGGLPTRRRRELVELFRKGELHALLTTDVAARGLELPRVHHVVSYEPPQNDFAKRLRGSVVLDVARDVW